MRRTDEDEDEDEDEDVDNDNDNDEDDEEDDDEDVDRWAVGWGAVRAREQLSLWLRGGLWSWRP